MKVIGIAQPCYLAWITLFQRIACSDQFVYLDDVAFSKNNFHNRNRIRTHAGEQMLTVPVCHNVNSGECIHRMPPNASIAWQKKHWRTIEMSYSKAPYFSEVADFLRPAYEKTWHYLGELNVHLIELFKTYLSIGTPTVTSSSLHKTKSGNAKLIQICHELDATHLLVKPNTEHYHPPQPFNDAGISFCLFTPEPIHYEQLHSPFIPGLSILDYAMNCGPTFPPVKSIS